MKIKLYSYKVIYFDEFENSSPLRTQGILAATDYVEATKLLRDYYGDLGDLFLAEFENVAEFPKSVVEAFERDSYSFNECTDKVTH